MNVDDYAILIGIDKYPQLGEGNSPVDLRGPRNDVDAIKAWLLDPLGGGLPGPQNLFEAAALPGVPNGAASPSVSDLDVIISRIDDQAQANRNAGKGMTVGRRIYIYMSGHGFSPGRQRACLFTADAKERLGLNVHASGWLNWLQDAGYFREFVLWVDACMNRASFIPPHDPPMQMVNSNNPPLANFVAFAAQRPLKAVEVAIPQDDNKVHGVFTWTLLEGLRGAAADPNGRVTGRGLADWIRNAMSARFDQRDREDREVAQEPEVIQEDSGLVFARGVTAPSYDVTASFPAASVGRTANLWCGTPPAISQSFTVQALPKVLPLRPGLYLLEVPGAGLRQGFEVLRPMIVKVTDAGPPVIACNGSDVFQFDVSPGDATAEIFLVDTRFSLVDRGRAELSTPLPSGLFKVKVRIGNATNETVILLDRDRPPSSNVAEPQLLATVVPLPETDGTHEYHEAARKNAIEAANKLVMPAGLAVVVVMVRTYSARTATSGSVRPPWVGVVLVDANDQVVVDMEATDGVVRHTADDACAYCVKTVPPGSYFLRQRLDQPTGPGSHGGMAVGSTPTPSHPIEQSIIVCAGWRTEVYSLRRLVPGAMAVDGRPRIAIMMRRHGDVLHAASQEEDRLTEAAKHALTNERRILTDGLEEMLMLKFRNPVAGIIGAHLMLIERERNPARDLTLLDTVVRNLRGLVGLGHPDVEALALQCNDARLRRVGALSGPPMFQRSWALLANGARKRVDLIPAVMWARVQAQSALAPFLVWTTDEETKSAARREIARAIHGSPDATVKLNSKAEVRRAPSSPVTPSHTPRSALGVAPMARVRRGGDAFAGASRAARSRAATMNVPPSAFESLEVERK